MSAGDIFNLTQIQETLDNIKKISVSNGYPFLIGKVEQKKKFSIKKHRTIFQSGRGPKALC